MKSTAGLLLLCLMAATASAGHHRIIDTVMRPIGARNLDGMIMNGGRVGSKIVGGQEAEPHSRPFQVGLFVTLESGGVAFCGGSLISSTVVLTAAHCIFDGQNQGVSFDVVLGAHEIRAEDNLVVTTTRYLIHEAWSPSLLQNDIALLYLPNAVELNEYVGVVELPPVGSVNELFEGQPATVSGWGKASDESTTIADKLRQVSTPIMTNSACNLRFLGVIQNTHVCGDGSDRKGSCSGDSGGPLTLSWNDEDIQVGVVSFGLALGCERNWPSVYTRVTSYLDWITRNAGLATPY